MDELKNEEDVKEVEEPKEEGEKRLKFKLLDAHFNFAEQILYWIAMQLKYSKEITPIRMKSELNLSFPTYNSYINLLRKYNFIIKATNRRGIYIITEKLVNFIQKHWFVIKAIHDKTFNYSQLNELLEKGKSVTT